jgi:hypothetical protein
MFLIYHGTYATFVLLTESVWNCLFLFSARGSLVD